MSNQPLQRIPQSFIDTLLDRTDIVDVVDSRVKLKRSGRNYTACCPFHKEKTPSFSVQPEKQFYYCFGCGAGGNALSFLMELDHLNFPEAVEELARRAGLDVPKQDQQLSSQEVASQQAKLQARNQSLELLEQTNQFFQQQLRQHAQKKQAVDYLTKRGLSGGIAKRFGVGFAPPGWQNLMDAFAPDADLLQAMLANGLVVQKEGSQSTYDFFRERIMFPIRNAKGKVIAFGGRVLGDSKPKYLNSPETEVFHKERELYGWYEARQHERNLTRILVVEGYMDVVALAQHQINFAVATLGTSTSQYHLERIFRLVKEVVFCFDGDAAGIKAAIRAMHTCLPLMADGRQARFLLLPQGEDPDSLVRAEGTEAFSQRIATATPFSEFLFNHFSEGLDGQQLEHRAKLATDIWPLIASMPKGLIQSMMKQKLANITGHDEDTMAQLFSVSQPTKPTDETTNKEVVDLEKGKGKEKAKQSESTTHTQKNMPLSGSHQDYSYGVPPAYEEANFLHGVNDYEDNYAAIYATGRPWQLSKQAFSVGKVLSAAQQAIKILLQNPEIALELQELPEHLLALHQADVKMLVRLMQACQRLTNQLGRNITSAELISELSVANDEDWLQLRDLAALESLSEAKDRQAQFFAVIEKLQFNYLEQRIDDVLGKLDITDEQAQKADLTKQLQTLLNEKKYYSPS